MESNSSYALALSLSHAYFGASWDSIHTAVGAYLPKTSNYNASDPYCYSVDGSTGWVEGRSSNRLLRN